MRKNDGINDVMILLMETWNSFLKLSNIDQREQEEFSRGIEICQRILMDNTFKTITDCNDKVSINSVEKVIRDGLNKDCITYKSSTLIDVFNNLKFGKE